MQTDSRKLTRYGIGKPKKKHEPKEKGFPPWGNGWQRGILMLLVCAVLSNSNRVAGKVVCGEGRPTPNGGARNGKKR